MKDYYNFKNKKNEAGKTSFGTVSTRQNQLEPALDEFYQPGKNQVKPGLQ